MRSAGWVGEINKLWDRIAPKCTRALSYVRLQGRCRHAWRILTSAAPAEWATMWLSWVAGASRPRPTCIFGLAIVTAYCLYSSSWVVPKCGRGRQRLL